MEFKMQGLDPIMSYSPPTEEQMNSLRVNAGIDELAHEERFMLGSPDLVEAIVAGIGEFARDEFSPLDRIGDRVGASLEDGTVRLPDGFAQAYRRFREQGWNGVAAPVEYGGQGLPFSLAVCVMENLGAANLAFSLLPMLTLGAIEAIEKHGSELQKAVYLPKLVSGEWTGTMNLTEPQAGSDVGALRTTATPIENGEHAGRFRIKGTKIFITWGDHELAENIIHLVLARLPGAPLGSRGISLFLVPKYLVGADGELGARNNLRAVGLEHKMGLHASPTCVMSYGEDDGCIGELLGELNGGLRAMFTMMNSARINVGAQGVELAEAAWQKAAAYARERVQSSRAGAQSKMPVAIVEHPDVRRMLLRMRALTEGARALLYYACGQIDRGNLGNQQSRVNADLLVPMVKAWCTDAGCEVASLAVQVHGGSGFVEDTGVAKHYRDARIGPIYEGTNGIQAVDLVLRKLQADNGEALQGLMAGILQDAKDEPGLAELARRCCEVASWMLEKPALDDRLAGASPFLAMCATAVAGWQLARQTSQVAEHWKARKTVVSRYFLDCLVHEAIGLHRSVMFGKEMLYHLDSESLLS